MQIDRRTVLKGFGATLALPFLESMMPQGVLAASVPKTPIRTAFIFVPNGINMQHWVPSGNELPYTLQPLQSLKINLILYLAWPSEMPLPLATVRETMQDLLQPG